MVSVFVFLSNKDAIKMCPAFRHFLRAFKPVFGWLIGPTFAE